MKNTGILYSSTEKSPAVLPEFAGLLPPLSPEQLSSLETDILANGCYAPIIVDENLTVIDGHNRQNICAEHDIPYSMLVFSFEDTLEAKQWALNTQKGRRNLTLWELGQIALKLKPEIETRAQANKTASGGDKKSEMAKSVSATLPEPISAVDTRKELADAVGIGQRTMGKVMQIDEHGPEVVKAALDKKELSINQGYNITKEVRQLPEDQREIAAAEAIRKLDTEIDQRAKVSRQFCTAYEKAALLTPTEEYVRIWTECSRMTPDEMADTVQESLELAETFTTIAKIIQTKILPADWRCAHEDTAAS